MHSMEFLGHQQNDAAITGGVTAAAAASAAAIGDAANATPWEAVSLCSFFACMSLEMSSIDNRVTMFCIVAACS